MGAVWGEKGSGMVGVWGGVCGGWGGWGGGGRGQGCETCKLPNSPPHTPTMPAPSLATKHVHAKGYLRSQVRMQKHLF